MLRHGVRYTNSLEIVKAEWKAGGRLQPPKDLVAATSSEMANFGPTISAVAGIFGGMLDKAFLPVATVMAAGAVAKLTLTKEYKHPAPVDEDAEPVDPDKLVFEGSRYGGAFAPRATAEEEA